MIINYPSVIQEALGIWFAFQKIGYQAKDIYLEMAGKHIFITVFKKKNIPYADEMDTFRVDCGPYTQSSEEISEIWIRLAEEIKEGPNPSPELEECYQRCSVGQNSLNFVLTLEQRGFPNNRDMHE